MQKIRQHPQIQWWHVPTTDNPADLASRGGQVTNTELWWNGPTWLRDPEMWPENQVTMKTQASEEKAKVIREVLSLANDQPKQERNLFVELLERHDLRPTLPIQAWVRRFTTHRARKGPLMKTYKRREIGGSEGSSPKTHRSLSFNRPGVSSTSFQMPTEC